MLAERECRAGKPHTLCCMPTHVLSYIPSPSANGFHLGPLYFHFYGLMYVIGITLAIIITRRRWRAVGGNPDLVGDVALWARRLGDFVRSFQTGLVRSYALLLAFGAACFIVYYAFVGVGR